MKILIASTRQAVPNLQRCVRADEWLSPVNQRRRGGRIVLAAIMDFLLFNDVSLLPKSGIGHLCEDLNSIVGQGLRYDEYKVRNTP
jgi:hypothetical protein